MSELLTSATAEPSPPVRRAAASRQPEPPRAAARDVPVLVKAMAALVVLYLAALLFGRGSGAAAALSSCSFVLFPALSAAACWTGVPRLPAAQRRTWRLIASAMTLYAFGGLVWTVYAVQGLTAPFPSLAEVGFLGWAAPLSLGLLALPIAEQSRTARVEIALDSALIFTSVMFCAWELVLEPISSSSSDHSLAESVSLCAYPAVDVLVIAAALATLMRVRTGDVRSWLSLSAGLLLVAAADLMLASMVARGVYENDAPYNILWPVAFLCIALAPHLGGLSHPAGQRLSVARALVPYGALGAAVAVLLRDHAHPQDSPVALVLATAVFVVAAVRQLAVVVLKARAADDLEGQVVSATAELRAERQFLAAVVDSLHAGIVACDRDGNLTLCNTAAAQFHSDPTLLRAADWASDLHTSDGTSRLASEDVPLLQALTGRLVHDVEFMIIPPEAPALALTASGRALRDAQGDVIGAVVAMHDVTERRRQQSSLEWKAAHDDLTGLGNRWSFMEEISRRLGSGLPAAVLLLDLDDFKHVNDSLGHDTGDRCLIAVADRLLQALPEGGIAYRLGGDEFVVVLDAERAEPEACAQALLDRIAAPTRIAGQDLRITASIGLAVRGEHCPTARDLLQAADLAMYVAKGEGKAGVCVFEDRMRRDAQDRLALEADLRRAIADGGLRLQYQPIVALASGRMAAAEALVRWDHPVRGPIPPADFIPIAEQCDLILPLGAWVLREAADQLLRWDAQGGDDGFRVTVNVSTRQLERPGLLEALDRSLAAGVRPDRLVLEVTETALALDSATALETMHAVRARGVQLAVDDFGTGYSSLSRLRSAPVTRIKIDRSFVSEITAADAQAPIVEATMAMAHGLGMGVIAEGVETAEQLAYLTRSGCPEVQGYFLSKPVDAAAVLACMTDAPWAAVLPVAVGARPGCLS